MAAARQGGVVAHISYNLATALGSCTCKQLMGSQANVNRSSASSSVIPRCLYLLLFFYVVVLLLFESLPEGYETKTQMALQWQH